MIKYKIDIMQALRDAGFTTTQLRRKKLIGEGSLTIIRSGRIANPPVINNLCAMLNCQPGDLLEYVPDDLQHDTSEQEQQ